VAFGFDFGPELYVPEADVLEASFGSLPFDGICDDVGCFDFG
jgi:hypothetical protein